MKVAVAGDHAGFVLKQALLGFLTQDGFEVTDLGTDTGDVASDYPDFARAVGDAITSGRAERGILVCGSGVGVSVAANKIKGIYAGLCHDTYSAHQGVEHDGMNVLCIGARVIGIELAREVARSFLHANFTREERHVRRVGKLKDIELKS
jgi:RpiB/LacA/LacB family sugar-phosphate isomerase